MRMALECFGHFVAEAYLRELCGWDESGVVPSKVVKAAIEHFALKNSRVARLTLEELQDELTRKLHPIVYLDLLDLGPQDAHAVIVLKITAREVRVMDPDRHKQVFELSEFARVWSGANFLTIILES